MGLQLHRSPTAHLRFEGRSIDLPFVEMSVDSTAADEDIKRAAAAYLEVHPSRLRDYVIDRHEGGNVTIRPQAVFG